MTVALGGDGGDELFCGYDPFRALRRAELYEAAVPGKLHAAIRAIFARLPVSHRNMSLDFKIKRTLRGLSYDRRYWVPIWMAPLDPVELSQLFDEPVRLEDVYSEAIEAWEKCPQDDLVDKTIQFYARIYLQDDILSKVDRASMLHSLEVRAPFLDIELVDFVRRIPSAWKIRRGTTKYILKQALRGVLPESILHRSKKGFGTPVGSWFEQGALQVDPNTFRSFNHDFIARKTEEHRRGKSDERAFLWNAYVLAKWGDAFSVDL